MHEYKPERTDSWSQIADAPRAAEAAGRLERLGRSPSEVEVRRRALDLLALTPGNIAVDVGAGSGTIAVEMARRVAPGGRVFAVDPSALLLDQARAHGRESGVGHLIDYRVADGRGLPFGTAAFDAALCHWVLAHVDRPEAVIAETKRVTRRGGKVVCVEIDWETVMVHPGEPNVTRRILQHGSGRYLDGWIGRKLPGLFRRCGFSDVVVEPIVSIDEAGGDRAWLEFLHRRAGLALDSGLVDAETVAGWTAALDQAFASKTYFLALVQFLVVGRVPG
ncbi:MAG: methyltransferase domain-containing protein [Bauldia sp.]